MAGLFAIILTFATLITGVFWLLEKFLWKPARQRKVEFVRSQSNGQIDGKILAEVGKPNNILEGIGSFFPVLFFVFVMRSFIFEPFQIPSGSMMQTLLVGDFIAVQKYSYGIRNPITNNVLISTGKPARGDVAVFKHPSDPKMDLIKRVVGLPGDKIVYSLEEKQLYIYPACQPGQKNCSAQSSTPLNLEYSPVQSSKWKLVYRLSNNNPNFYTLQQYSEQTDLDTAVIFDINVRDEKLGDHVHKILLTPEIPENANAFYQQIGQPIATWVVPENSYFMMGDNRDNSADSRYFGFVPEQNFVGKASAIWMSFEKQSNEWPTGVRFSRIGLIH